MIRRSLRPRPAGPLAGAVRVGAGLLALAAAATATAQATLPVTPAQRSTAQQVAQQGVPFEELAPDAPDSYTVKSGDTLWRISGLFLRKPWRWPELWGMNLADIRNPHLIYPGQVLWLDRSGDRARLRLGQPVGGGSNATVKLSPRVRSGPVGNDAISSVPLHLIAPFLNEAVVFNTDELGGAPRVVAAPEGRVLMSRGELAYVRGDLGGLRDWRLFRETKPLRDPETQEVLGHEARFVGTAEFVRPGDTVATADGKAQVVPATVRIISNREEVGIGDRLAPVPSRDFSSYAPHAPANPVNGRIIAIYGDALSAGQNQIVSLNRGSADGMERGHVLSLWQRGATTVDRSDPDRAVMQLPDERNGLLFVFSVFDRVSYALILQVQAPVRAGDRFTQPD
ncbi:LysM peptidoglycan-binding domain-containing protein [Aquincola tertiaricarbonis]|uniref:LysM peptidoglycan-binding domain-containing protein n=1 Tax=Aquincola tertiaricarbonis TaxID=391953 RepID=A0ABY4S907_AQUTE|nr:LysM domain-containing protein [Aquincola tertiaricarbonis]URI09848.1 LysM peptidoglycan-binding domain-containing protein [Aquincola tertiaricarbonis]